MKIKINENQAVDVAITQTSTTQNGNAYWTIDYMYKGVCIHSATTGCIAGNPNPIAMLDRIYTIPEYHYQDIPTPDPQPEGGMLYGKAIKVGSVNGRPAWWAEKEKTHRQAISEALAQVE